MAKKSEALLSKIKEQRKTTLKECCELYLHNPALKSGMARLLVLFDNIKMKPRWYHSTSYKCYHKNEIVVYIHIYDGNLKLKVCAAASENIFGCGDVGKYIHGLDNDTKTEFISRIKPCVNCLTKDGRNKQCNNGHDIEIDGMLHKGTCKNSLFYEVKNPTAEQFRWIEKFIYARRDFIAKE